MVLVTMTTADAKGNLKAVESQKFHKVRFTFHDILLLSISFPLNALLTSIGYHLTINNRMAHGPTMDTEATAVMEAMVEALLQRTMMTTMNQALPLANPVSPGWQRKVWKEWQKWKWQVGQERLLQQQLILQLLR